MKGSKRAPILADLVLATQQPNIGGSTPEMQREYQTLRSKLRWAERFVFDTEASERVAVVLRDVPELLARQIQFARPPFDLCWIEYDCNAIFDLLNPGHNDYTDKTRDRRVGALIHHNRITVMTESFDGRLGLLPFAYHLNTEWPLQDQIQFAETLRISRLGIDYWLWGAAIANLDAQYLRTLRDTNRVEILAPTRLFTDQNAIQVANSVMGDFKNHVAVLLMLNQPRLTQYATVPSTRGWIGNRHKPFRSFTNVRVALDPVPTIRRLSEGGGAGELRRRHRVRGHYCHNEAAKKAILHHTCDHDWQAADQRWELVKAEVGDDVEHWVCARCAGKRWWREEHERGDKNLGYVDHREYQIVS